MTGADIDEELVMACVRAMDDAYCPYSGFPVGCALRDERGRLHVGVNVENAAYPVGTCAEAGAIAAMAAAGGKRISVLAVAVRPDGLTTPCGACRQRIREFADATVRIYVCGPEGHRATFTLGELLPSSFGPESLP